MNRREGKENRRRKLLVAIGGTSLAWTALANAQDPQRTRVIGFLGVDPVAWKPWTAGFVDRMRELGWIEGRNARTEFRWSEGRSERYAEIAAEFVRQKVDIIVTSGAAVPTLMKAVPDIPVVFAVANDPVKSGIVRSLARPGGKITGISLLAPELAGKRLELLREAAPGLRHLAVMADVGFPQAVFEMREVEAIAQKFGIKVTSLEIRSAQDIEPAFDSLKGQAGALYVVINELLNFNRARIVNLALKARLPSIYGTRDWTQSGGLMAYGPNFPNLFRRAAEMADKILRGTSPGDIPVEQPTNFELTINRKTSMALGLTMPKSILVRADEVIE